MTPMMTPTVNRWAFLFPMSMPTIVVHGMRRAPDRTGRGLSLGVSDGT